MEMVHSTLGREGAAPYLRPRFVPVPDSSRVESDPIRTSKARSSRSWRLRFSASCAIAAARFGLGHALPTSKVSAVDHTRSHFHEPSLRRPCFHSSDLVNPSRYAPQRGYFFESAFSEGISVRVSGFYASPSDPSGDDSIRAGQQQLRAMLLTALRREMLRKYSDSQIDVILHACEPYLSTWLQENPGANCKGVQDQLPTLLQALDRLAAELRPFISILWTVD
jgi:hypothetical protein